VDLQASGIYWRINSHSEIPHPFGLGLPTSPRNPFGKLTFYVWLFVVDYRFTDSQSTWHFVIYHSITLYAQLLAGFTLCCNQLPTSVLNLSRPHLWQHQLWYHRGVVFVIRRLVSYHIYMTQAGWK